MNRKKLYVQITVCALVLGGAFLSSRGSLPQAAGVFDRARETVMHQMTAADLRAMGSRITGSLSGMPSKVVSAVARVNDQSKYGVPIDQKSSDGIKQVHAAAGGVVEASGKDDTLGLYIRLRHEDAVTVYGNLSDIGVVEKERVQRGEIIGSYDTASEKEFYYDLQENL